MTDTNMAETPAEQQTTNDAPAAADAVTPFYPELVEAAKKAQPKFKEQAKKEAVRDFLTRLMKAVAETDQETVFDKMTQAAQDWFNDTAKALNVDAKAEIPAPAGFAPLAEKPAAAAKPPKEPKEPKAAAAPKEPKVRVRDDTKPTNVLRRLIVTDPNLSSQQLADKMKELGHDIKTVTVSTLRTDTLATLRAAQAAGQLKEGLTIAG